ncbi:MAG: hypothetical protein HC883_01610 [Bdellovibrionaceae bacterium]|nr:hypothetical protein [Pseudobdellovibrionaceae bacterium]
MGNQQENETLAKMAYVIGFFLGDGGLYRQLDRDAYRIHFTKMDIECLEAVMHVLGRKTIRKHGSSFRIEYYGKDLYEFLAFNTEFRTVVPYQYITASEHVVKELVAGLMDSDGSVTHTESEGYDRWQLSFTNTERKLMEAMQHFLRKSGVDAGKITTVANPGHRMVMHIRPNLKQFAERGFYFRNLRKMQRLNDYMQKVHASETLYAAPSLG